MANLKEISRQISSVTSTQKITKAMKLVATVKLKKAQKVRENASIYATKINEVLSSISDVKNKNQELCEDRLFAQNDKPKKVDIILITADKGLCGGFNHASVSTANKIKKEYEAKGAKVRLLSCGKKGSDYFNFNKISMHKQARALSSAPTYEKAEEFVQEVFEDFMSEKSDKVILIYNGFKNMLAQEVKTKTVFPIELSELNDDKRDCISDLSIESDNSDQLLKTLANKYAIFCFYYGLLDSLTAEYSARMQAMDNAVRNAGEKKDELTVFYNKARQAAITTELVEIISGVESLK